MRQATRLLGVLALLLLGALALPAGASATFPGQNGKIAFVRGGDIWTMNPDGTGQVNLTNSPGNEFAPSWSADGNRIAFARSTGYEGQIWTMLADGTGQVQTAGFGSGPSWSPDGQKIASAIDGRCEWFPGGEMGGVWTFPSDGSSSMTPLACGSGDRGQHMTSWSPDGQTIAFRDDLGCIDIHTIPAAGGADTTLTPDCGAIDEDPNYSPDGQKIAWSTDSQPPSYSYPHIWKMNSDGTGKTQVTTGSLMADVAPAWSPDGSKLVFEGGGRSPPGLYVVNPDGTSLTFITAGTDPDWQPLPTAGPEADLLASISDSPDPIPVGGRLHYIASAKNFVGPDDATGVTLTVTLDPNAFFVSATPTQGSCSQASNVVTCQFGNLPKGSTANVDIAIEPRFPTPISASASVSGNETDPIPSNNSASTTTTVTSGGQPRPKGATPLRASLAIAYRSCSAGEENEQHGGPFNVPSCSPPVQASSYLTVGTLDANGQAAGFIGSVRFDVIEGDTNPSNGDQADVALHAALTDVRNKPGLTDYTGELEGQTTLRITDHDNSAGYFAAATVQDMPLDYTIPCTATGGAIGSTCALNTTVDALTGGGVKELKRSIWQLDRVRVTDGGADGSASTLPNTMFATQGVFVP